mmetsp:Transcript_17408/g.40689  ORF Transcript_17408/g.40689 Transcript_17408/m.40689 type:complete len:84 (+) Transcript_17408:984-1235(+)
MPKKLCSKAVFIVVCLYDGLAHTSLPPYAVEAAAASDSGAVTLLFDGEDSPRVEAAPTATPHTAATATAAIELVRKRALDSLH